MKTALLIALGIAALIFGLAGDFSPFALRAVAGFTIATLFFFALLSLHK
jgi:hypothetical protein